MNGHALIGAAAGPAFPRRSIGTGEPLPGWAALRSWAANKLAFFV